MIWSSSSQAARGASFTTAAVVAAGMAILPPAIGPAAAQEAQAPAQAPIQAPVMRGPASVADLAEGLLGAVVNISTSQNMDRDNGGAGQVPMPELPEGSPFQDFFDEFFNNRQGNDGSPRQVQSLGSGFIIDAEEGIVVTNNHVIEGADQIAVNFSDGSKLNAELVGKDPKTDLAVLKIDPTKKKLTAVKFGDSDAMRIGDWVMAIGNPFGLGGSVTVGIVSARNREIGSGPYDDYIQTDAAINRGNSGGPLFNMNGEVIGINTAIISPTGGSIGIGFSIPSELAVSVINQLREFGETRRGWLGVRIQEVTDEIAESLGMDGATGALVSGIMEGGPVDNGVIEPGDVIIRFDGKEIDDMHDLPRIVAESPVGKEVDVVIVRKGEEQTVKVKLGRLEDGEKLAETEAAGEQQPNKEGAAEPAETAKVLGMSLAALDEETRSQFGISEDVSGVVITEVAPNSPAAEKGVAAGEVVAEIAQETVSSPQQMVERLETLKKQGRKNALLM
ncbi:MAG TPA: DegQ family serine endoprotease, partial [Rhizobiaceae bacterium]|nr:DegQ family serine endoprotease [Rhizobiaceae bacterium]